MNSREIEFRARIMEDGKPKMFYQDNQFLISFLRRVSSQLYFLKDTKEEGVNEMNGGVHESYLKPYELENCLDMWTGLFDKNGKKIFEGDILDFQNGFIREILFSDGCFRLRDNPYQNDYKHGEIIGNIYENPELLFNPSPI